MWKIQKFFAIKTFFLFSLIIFSGLFLININSAKAVTAETCYWTASTSLSMSVNTNWQVAAGTACIEIDSSDALVFDATSSTANAQWDGALTQVTSVTVSAGYTGNIYIGNAATTTGNFTVNAGTVTATSTGLFKIGGNLTVGASGTFSGGSVGNLQLYGADKTLGGAGSVTLYDLAVEGTVTLAGNTTVTHVLTINAGKTLNAGTYTLTLSGTGTPLVHAGGTFNNGSGTVTYSGATANVASTTYSNLTLNTGTYTMLAATTVTGTLTNTGTFVATSTLTLSGAGTPFVNSGTFTANSSTVTYTNAGTVTTTGATYWTLTFGSGTYAFGGNTTSTNSFTNGGLLTIGASYYLYVPGTFDNNGTTTESGIIKHPLTSAKLTDVSGNEITAYLASDSVYIRVIDSDGNLAVNGVDTITGSVVTASTYSDSETITLTETGVDTSIFQSAALPFTLFTRAVNNNAQFEVAGNGTLSLAFTDSKDSTDTGSDTASFFNSNLPSGGGGGGSSSADTTPPTNTSISIANGAVSVFSVNVTLKLGATGASQMMISNTSDFIGSSWETNTASKEWVLTSGSGVKTVYAKFKDTAGNISTVISDTIELLTGTVDATPAPVVVVTPVVTIPEVVTTPLDVTVPVTIVAPVASYNFAKNLVIGSVNAEVRELQKVLKDAGYFKYPSITNYFGTVTKNALIAYQKANDLTATGKLDSATRAVLNGTVVPAVEEVIANSGYKFTRYLYVGSSGTEVSKLQQVLKDLGYYTLPAVTGYFGPATKVAVVKFQKDKGISLYPGWVGPSTRAVLNSL